MKRVFQAEQMDGPNLDPRLLAEDLRNLELLNRFFGGNGVVRRRVSALLSCLERGAPVSILDIGSGAGDLCRSVVRLCRGAGHPVRLWSLDFHPQVQAFAREACAAEPEIRFLRGDARRIPLREGSVDLVLCTLALHHFVEADAAQVLREMRRVARRWAVVSDLHRSPQAYAGVWFATRFTRNPMTRWDGPASVRRAFTAEELGQLAAQAGWETPRRYSEPWFRMSLVWERAGRW